MMRFQLRAAGALVLAGLAIPAWPARGQDIRVTLLGTGAPPPSLVRFGPATLVEAGGQRYLFDAGRGSLQRLAQVAVPWNSIDGVFPTHLHSDHVMVIVVGDRIEVRRPVR